MVIHSVDVMNFKVFFRECMQSFAFSPYYIVLRDEPKNQKQTHICGTRENVSEQKFSRIRPQLKPVKRQHFNERIDFQVIVVYKDDAEMIFFSRDDIFASRTNYPTNGILRNFVRDFFSLSRNRSTMFSTSYEYREYDFR